MGVHQTRAALGDFQTPAGLAVAVLATLPRKQWATVLEPTCGTGSFLRAAAAAAPGARRVGVEIQPAYAEQARAYADEVREDDVFTLDAAALGLRAPLLVVGNPPWVTNAALTRLGSENRPLRENLHRLPGIAAITGASNFDVAEFVWIKLLRDLAPLEPTIALLCKTQTAHRVLGWCLAGGAPLAAASIRRVDAWRWFGANVDACLLTVEVGPPGSAYAGCAVYADLASLTPTHMTDRQADRPVGDLGAHAAVARFDGTCPYEWRQGVKHDAAAVMELVREPDGGLRTRAGEPVDVEPENVHPLLKCTDLFHGRTAEPRLAVVVTQPHPGVDTAGLATAAPRLWAYLQANGAALDARKSSIYRKRPRFAMFGVGPYTFAPYKVAISGLHKQARFRLVGPVGGRPVLFDDTCYFLGFSDGAEAARVAALLASDEVAALLDALVDWGAKRPVTKKVLQRIDLGAVAAAVG